MGARSKLLYVVFLITVTTASACNSPTEPGSGGNGGGGQSSPPTITCPAAPAPVTAPSNQPMSVVYGTATATGTGVNVTCSPPSGTPFPIGSTSVVCTATDSAGRTAACSFTVVVQVARRLGLTRFAAFGDSITWGEDGTNYCSNSIAGFRTFSQIRTYQRLPSAQQYPSLLQDLLQQRYPTQAIQVTQLGVPGEAAVDAVATNRFRDSVITPHFDAVLLMEGANDINRGDANGGINALQTMVQMAKQNTVRPFLATIPPEIAGRYYTLNPAAVTAFNARVRAIATAQGVTLVDVEAAFGSSPGNYISCDGLHPNPEGYRLIANTFYTVLTQTLETAQSQTTTLAAPAPVLPRSQARPRP